MNDNMVSGGAHVSPDIFVISFRMKIDKRL